ncbi:MAG: hypothetical protein RDU20_09000 [Desulfomonilaceae bacterium]|nr:hypothetical protein [Desulfomonilaceae bacterium]
MMTLLTLAACLVGVLLGCADTVSWAQETKAPLTYRIPTTGEIMDVTYLPEFDEWWVKCREGRNISIYSYDKGSKKWRHAVFVPEKPVEKAQKTVKPEKPGESVPAAGTHDEGTVKTQERQEGSDAGTTLSGSEQDAGKKKPEDDKKKWWDPLKLLKGDKKTIAPKDQPLP